jgi:DNA-binding beta-propeller fold protein YncE
LAILIRGFGSKGFVCLVSVLGLLTGCVATPTKTESKVDTSNLTWPLPPDEPRIRFVAEYRGEADFQKDDLKKSLFGDEKSGTKLMKPHSVTASEDGNTIYVTDPQLQGVVVFDLKNKRAGQMVTDAHGGLRNPIEIESDKRGRLFVTDSVRNEVLVYSPEGKTLLALGKKEDLGRPTGLALDEARNRVYVADTIKHRIVVYDLDGNFVAEFGQRGSEPGQYNYPVHLAIDQEGRLLVSDTGNFRIQIVDGQGRFISTFGQVGDGLGNFSRPKGIALDSDANIYVADAAFNNFQIFDRDGRLLLFVGSAGDLPGMFLLPTGMHIDAQDKVYVVDSVNARVQVFQYLKGKEGRKADK